VAHVEDLVLHTVPSHLQIGLVHQLVETGQSLPQGKVVALQLLVVFK